MTRRGFRNLIVLNWLLIAGAVITAFATESLLPAELRAYLDAREAASLTQGQVALASAGALLAILAVAVSVGLFRFRRWARRLLPLSYALGLLLIPALGPTVETGWASLMSYLCVLADGVILGAVFLSPLREEFEASRDV